MKMFGKQTADLFYKNFEPLEIHLYIFCLAGSKKQPDKFSAKYFIATFEILKKMCLY